jgi:hypothetical protein
VGVLGEIMGIGIARAMVETMGTVSESGLGKYKSKRVVKLLSCERLNVDDHFKEFPNQI